MEWLVLSADTGFGKCNCIAMVACAGKDDAGDFSKERSGSLLCSFGRWQ